MDNEKLRSKFDAMQGTKGNRVIHTSLVRKKQIIKAVKESDFSPDDEMFHKIMEKLDQ